MEGIKKELAVMETVELQLLGSLHKLQSGNNQGLKDIDTIASRIKASCKSMRAKLDVVERRMVNEKKSAIELQRELDKVKASNMKLEIDLNKSTSLLEECFDESWVENEDSGEPEQKAQKLA
jgi:poly(A) polymerase Pap1